MYTKFKHEKRISDLPSTMSLALPICYHPSFSLWFIALCAVAVCMAKGGGTAIYLCFAVNRAIFMGEIFTAKINRDIIQNDSGQNEHVLVDCTQKGIVAISLKITRDLSSERECERSQYFEQSKLVILFMICWLWLFICVDNGWVHFLLLVPSIRSVMAQFHSHLRVS